MKMTHIPAFATLRRGRQNFILASGLAITAASALGQSTDGLDRTVLPIREPQYPPITELDARNAKPPPRFEIKAPAAAPNVVIVLLDDIGFGHSGAFGGPCNMPTLDRLAANGLRYNAFHTTALCSPTRTAQEFLRGSRTCTGNGRDVGPKAH